MAIQFRRIAGAVRQNGRLVPFDDGEAVPEPPLPEPAQK